jgi:histidinol-phosphate/aromatic aminotransferase/cobyric acid decarboxylase-like protein
MKPFNKEEYNRMCAEFMEWDYIEKKFDTDWNWIMEVVEKIQYYKALIISINHCEIYFMPNDGIRINVGGRTTKEAVVQAIWEFLNWYNQTFKKD